MTHSAPVDQKSHVVLVDGSGYIFRAYHALPPLTRRTDGLVIGAVAGFSNMLFKLLREQTGENRPTHFAVIFDANTPLISVSKPENILATLVYSGQSNDLMGTLINGQWVVKNQKHLNQEAVQTSFTKSMRQINIR